MALWPMKRNTGGVAEHQPVGIDAGKDDLNELLLALSAYGQPRVSLMSEGWHAYVEVRTGVTGVSTGVASGFKEPTPLAAAQELASRVVNLLENATR